MVEVKNKKEGFDEFLKRNFWNNYIADAENLENAKETTEKINNIIRKEENIVKHDTFKETLERLDIKYRKYSGKLDKSLDWLLPEDELSNLEEEKAMQWVASYNQMKMDVLKEVDDYKKNWKRFENKNIKGVRKTKLEKSLLSASEGFLSTIDYREEFMVLGKNLKKAPVYIRYSALVMSVAYFAFFSVLFFPTSVVKLTSAIDDAVFGNIVRSGKTPIDNNFITVKEDVVKPILNKEAMSNFVKKNSRRLEFDREKGIPVINVSEEELFGQVAGVMEENKDR